MINLRSIIEVDTTTKEDINLKVDIKNQEVVEIFVVDIKNLVIIEIEIKILKSQKIIEPLTMTVNLIMVPKVKIEDKKEEEEKILIHITNLLQMMISNH